MPSLEYIGGSNESENEKPSYLSENKITGKLAENADQFRADTKLESIEALRRQIDNLELRRTGDEKMDLILDVQIKTIQDKINFMAN